MRDALVRALSLHPLQRFADATGLADALTHATPQAAPMPVAAAAVAEAPRRARAALGAVSVEPDEGTRLQTAPPAPAARPARERTVPPAFAAPRAATVPPPVAAFVPLAQALPAAPLQAPPAHAAAAAAPGQVVPQQPRPGGFRRFLSGVWNFTVTTAAMALFVGAWVLAGNGVVQGRMDQIYAGVAASVLFTPLAIHRLTTRRGRYGFTLFGSIIATATAVYYVGRDTDPAILLAAIFGLQVVTSFVMARLTRRRVAVPPYVGY